MKEFREGMFRSGVYQMGIWRRDLTRKYGSILVAKKKIPNIFVLQFSVVGIIANSPTKLYVFKKSDKPLFSLTNIHANAIVKMLILRLPNDLCTRREKGSVFQSSFDNFVIAIFKMHRISGKMYSDKFPSYSQIQKLYYVAKHNENLTKIWMKILACANRNSIKLVQIFISV